MHRRTKIVATIGPASEDETTLRHMMEAGMDVARIGLAHGTLDDGLARFHRIRAVAADVGRRVGILVDLPGPKSGRRRSGRAVWSSRPATPSSCASAMTPRPRR